MIFILYGKYKMRDYTTIRINTEIAELLKKVKEYLKQTYNELIKKMTQSYLTKKQNSQYKAVLQKIQQIKMQELWDNPEDEDWENVQ